MDEKKPHNKKSSYRIKEVYHILCDEIGEMGYASFEKYYRHHDKLIVRQSAFNNPRVGHKDLMEFIDYIKKNPIPRRND